MNRQMKNALVGILILLLAACGQFETAPAEAPEPIVTVTENPVSSTPTEIAPTAVATNESDTEKFSKYIGLNYPPIPVGLSERFSMMIQDSEDHGLWMVLEGADKMLWLTKITHYDSSGAAYWEVKDVLGLSNLEAGLVLITDGCFLNGKADNEILVALKNGKIQLAWRANTASDMFESIPTNGIECHSDRGESLD